MSFKERRRAPRVNVDLPVDVEGDSGTVTGRTINISTNGVYFEIPRYVEPMTRVGMGLVLPGPQGKKGSEARVSFDGVVVRVEPERPMDNVSAYRIAVFFTNIPQASERVLSSFIEKRLH